MALHETALRGLAVCAVAVVAAAAPATASADTTTIYVSTTGSDTATGTATAPLQTLGAALARATGGQRIQLGAGSFAAPTDERTRSATVTVVGQGTTRTEVRGLNVYGGQRLSFSGIEFSRPVRVQGHPVRHAAQPATAISFTGDEFTSPNNACVMVREGAQSITIAHDQIHDCGTGILGPGNVYVSHGITIDSNTIRDITGDGMQIGSWDDVRIVGNVIQRVYDPAGVIHNDGIQLTGNNANVSIERNWVSGSRSQLLFIQDAIGPIDHVDVVNNVLLHAGAVALQSQGATHASFVNNTIWDAKDGGLWLRAGYVRNGVQVVPTDTVLSNNLAPTIRIMEGAGTSVAAGNVMLCPGRYSGLAVPFGATCVSDPGFVNAAGANFRLTTTSAARPKGSGLVLPRTDYSLATRIGAVPGAYR